MSNTEPLSDADLERAVMGKILSRLVPFLAILYVFSLLDRGNVGIAAITMKQDLNFSDRAYALGVGMFAWGYFLFEVPSNLIMEKVGARRWIARIMITWGLISAGLMFITTPFSFSALRFILGLAEAGYFPGVILYLTYWVPARVRAQVIARFLFMTAILGLFGGPLGALLLKLDGIGGLRGWQWLFLLEGLPSVFLGFVVLKVLPDTPKQATWLTPAEKGWIAAQMEGDHKQTGHTEHLSWGAALRDKRILTLLLIFFLLSTGQNTIGSFMTLYLNKLGGDAWSGSYIAVVLTIPAIVGAVAMLLAAKHSDRTGNRRLHVAGGYGIAALSYAICLITPSPWGVILALSVNALGERIGAGSYWATLTNVLGPRAAAGGIAFVNSVGNLGGFFGPMLMGEIMARSGGNYTLGFYATIALVLASAIVALITLPKATAPSTP